MSNENDEFWQMFLVYAVIIVVGGIILLYVLVKKPEIDKLRKIKNIENIERCRKRFDDMKQHGIKTITIFVDLKEFHDTNSRYGLWHRVLSVYVNRKRIDIDKLYRKEDFIYKHCDNKYYCLTSAGVAIVGYDFGKEIKETLCYTQKKNQMKLRHYLPKCWD